jgi:SAM-dependent methyltransferase
LINPVPIPGSGDYWNNRFETHNTPWDLGAVSPPLKAYIDQLEDKAMRILIPGCGNGYEAEYLLAQGFTDITLIDIAPALTRRLEEKFSAHLNRGFSVITGDFFGLTGAYDLILEQTFFCALDPFLRPGYALKMQSLLKPGGKLAGVLFNRIFPAVGPPYGGSMEEYRELFAPLFRIATLEPCYNSAKPRAETECFFILQKE